MASKPTEYSPLDVDKTSNNSGSMTKWLLVGGLSVAVVVGIVVVVIFATGGSDAVPDTPPVDPASLVEAMAMENARVHFEALMGIALDHPNRVGVGSRSVLNGYNASADYVEEQLRSAGYAPTRQALVVPIYEELSRPALELIDGEMTIDLLVDNDFAGVRYGGHAPDGSSVAGEVFLPANDGCAAADWEGDVVDKIAVVLATGCIYTDKIFLAEDAGAVGVILHNAEGSTSRPGSRARTVFWRAGDRLVTVPVLGATHTVRALAEKAGVTFNITTHNQVTQTTTENLFAETPGTGEDAEANTIVVGAHLDSVAEGPGMNDDGSGSVAVLELALQMAALGIEPINRVRYCWWGAEEIGLLGSRHYVAELMEHEPEEFSNIALYQNFDMLGGANFARQIHEGEDSAADVPVRNASTVIQRVYERYFESVGKPWVYSPLRSGSDFVPFIENGIPSGGVKTGAGASKTMEERTLFGGVANAALDTCYHAPCDTVENIGAEIMEDNMKAMAFSITTLAHDASLRETLFPGGR